MDINCIVCYQPCGGAINKSTKNNVNDSLPSKNASASSSSPPVIADDDAVSQTFCTLFNINLCTINTCAQCFENLTLVHNAIEELKKKIDMAKTEITKKIVKSYRSSPTTSAAVAAGSGAIGAGTRAGTSRANEQTNIIREEIVRDNEDALNNKNIILDEDDSETDYESGDDEEVPVPSSPRNSPRISSSVPVPRTPPRTPPNRCRSRKRGILKTFETSPSLLNDSSARKKVSFNPEPQFKPISTNNMEKIGQLILECRQRPSIIQINPLPFVPSQGTTFNVNSSIIRRFMQREERSLRLKNLGIKKKMLFSSSNTII